MKYTTLATAWILAVVSSSLLQAQNPQIKPQKVIPPSPDAAALGKYGNTPVGYHTGIPNIDIPIYTVQSGSLQLPISISYHASGIRVSEIASWVGLGWSLNAGGAVSRTLVSGCDELGGFWSTATKNESQITVNDLDYVRGVANGNVDGESDLYFYNFNGHSGKFVYAQNDSQNPLIIPKAPIKISYVSNHFEITDEIGTLYKFSNGEQMSTSGDDPIGSYYSSYFLTEIISADGKDNILFSYVTEPGYTETNNNYTETIGQQCTMAGSPTNGLHTTSWSTTSRLTTPVRLTRITFSTGKVEFIRDLTRSDKPQSRLNEIQIFAKNVDGSYEPIPRKSFLLGEDYFVSTSGTGTDKYRLKLTNLVEKDGLGNQIRKHSFYYNETTLLPERTSLAQDWWGYYNGQTFNTSLIGTETINFKHVPYTVGAANREANGITMQACILNKIVYPTGGYTEFDYEANRYADGITKTPQSVSASAGAMGNTTDLLEQTVTFTPNAQGWAKVNTFCSDVTDANPFFSTVTVRKQNDSQFLLNHIYNPYSYTPYNSTLNKDFWIYLTAGVTYELKVMSKGNSTATQYSNAAFSQATVYWDNEASGVETVAGGLRVKEIRDYERSGVTPVTKIYKYGINESGIGTLLIPKSGLSSSKRKIGFNWHEAICGQSLLGCCQTPACSGERLTISGGPALELTTLNGAPVVYPEVAVYENSTSAPNGKQVFNFDVAADQFSYADSAYSYLGQWQINNSWKGGNEILNTTYKGNTTTKVKQTNSIHTVLSGVQVKGTKIGWRIQTEGCNDPTIQNNILLTYLYYFDYPVLSGVKKLISSKEKSYSSSDPTKFTETQEDLFYDNLGNQHQQLSRKITLDSEGSTIVSNYWYAADYAPSVDNNNIQALLNKNIIAVPVKEEMHKNGNLVSGKVTRMDQNGNPIEIHQYESATSQAAPAHNNTILFPANYVKRIDIAYDATTKNIMSTQQKDNTLTAYVWAYNNTLPIAEVTNAGTVSKVFHTSFEDNGSVDPNAAPRTGNKVWLGAYTFNLPATNGTYKLLYYQKTSPNPWGLPIEQTITVTSGTSQPITIGAAGSIIDEVRLFPVGSQMTTYTYDPIIGISSTTDSNLITTYYQYDNFGRLSAIKDDKGNTVKTYSYHFKEQ